MLIEHSGTELLGMWKCISPCFILDLGWKSTSTHLFGKTGMMNELNHTASLTKITFIQKPLTISTYFAIIQAHSEKSGKNLAALY